MRKCSSTILYAACTFRPYKSTPVLKLFRTFTGRMTKGLSLRMVFSLLFQDTLLISHLPIALAFKRHAVVRPSRDFSTTVSPAYRVGLRERHQGKNVKRRSATISPAYRVGFRERRHGENV